ncbi:hypothetical protein LTR86_007048 [Recurvomyces mirabilis]|nr:hypothetical protein LTR86_007048 [Recurvomyces mirabilis]
MAPKVLVHGSGAVGSIYIYLLDKAGCEVTAVCRSNYNIVKTEGFTIDSDLYGKGLRVLPCVARTPDEAVQYGPFDYVLVTTKALPSARTPQTIAPAVTTKQTSIVLVQNGIAIEEPYAEVFPNNNIISTVVYLPTTQTEPGKVQMGNVELLEVGTFPASAYQDDDGLAKIATDNLAALLKKGGSNVRFYDDIQERRWNKLLINASWNPICALTLSRDVAYLASSPAAEPLVSAVMAEVVAIAQALGYSKMDPLFIKEQMKKAMDRRGGKGIEPSMLVDVLSRRRMEVEVILGNPIRIAQRLGVPVPRLETLHALSAALDESIAYRQPGKSLGGDEARQSDSIKSSM